VNRIDQESEKEARAHKGCRAIQEEEEEGLSLPITMAARSKARTVTAPSNTWIVGSNLTQGRDVCVRLFCVRVVLCVGSGLATA
jgi:hypothetical protein